MKEADPHLPIVCGLYRFSLDNGPGIRTTVFLKGCPLACRWCHNPEAMSPEPEIFFRKTRCLGCGGCVKICPRQAIEMRRNTVFLHRQRCDGCGRCARVCPSLALQAVGSQEPAAELVELLLRDLTFFEVSGGGVTFSGGEATMHGEYLAEVLGLLKSQGIHTALQTSGFFEPVFFEAELLPRLDLVFFDLKLFSATEHRRWTGRSNDRILANFERLARLAPERLRPRIPLVPGATACKENLAALATFLRRCGFTVATLLPWFPGGREKRRALGRPAARGLSHEPMQRAEEDELRTFFNRCLTKKSTDP